MTKPRIKLLTLWVGELPPYVHDFAGRVRDIGLLGPAYTRLDALLQGSIPTGVAGGIVEACEREVPLRLGPLYGPGAITTYRLGGLYRLYLREE